MQQKTELTHNSSLQDSNASAYRLRKPLHEAKRAVLAAEGHSEVLKHTMSRAAHEAMANRSHYDGLAMAVAGVSYGGSLVTQFSELMSFFSTDEFNWPTHVFGVPRQRHPSGMWGIHDRVDWAVLAASVILVIVLDFCAVRPWFQSTSNAGLHRTLPVLAFWVSAGILFNGYIGWRHGMHDAVRWFNGYLLEWLLSMDNIFVFHLVFKLYRTPEHLLPKALFWGVFGAVLFRMIFFVTLNSLLHFVHWFYYVFGFFLVYSGFQAAHEGDEDDDLADSWVVRSLRWLLDDFLMPAPHYDMEGRFIVWANDNKHAGTSRVQISMLVPVVICLELTDILFAVDSVSAKVGQIPDQFVAYSSSVFAMFGLRALFFIVEDLVHRLRFLKYGLCFILIFIGAELLLANVVQLPATVVCIVLVSVFTFCVGLSVLIPENKPAEHGNEQC
jgi:tellurite resistance protein TerC